MKPYIALLMFLTAVSAALYYVSQEEHGTGTLLLLSAVLILGQLVVMLPWILLARRSRGNGTPENTLQKLTANQQVIHEDLRSLGEALIKRNAALTERMDAIEKKIADGNAALTGTLKEAAAGTPDLEPDFEEFAEKLKVLLEENGAGRTESLSALENTLVAKLDALPQKEKLSARFDGIEDRLDEIGELVGELVAERSENHDEKDFSPPVENFGDEEDFVSAGDVSEDAEIEEGNFVEDFPEEDDAEALPEAVPAAQEELPLGDVLKPPSAKLVLNAMLGIENKPFLRGRAHGLSTERGTPMDFAEIGKWTFDFEPSNEEITVDILRNDDVNAPLGEPVTLAPGQTLELEYVP